VASAIRVTAETLHNKVNETIAREIAKANEKLDAHEGRSTK
jgi:hypothetical protein